MNLYKYLFHFSDWDLPNKHIFTMQCFEKAECYFWFLVLLFKVCEGLWLRLISDNELMWPTFRFQRYSLHKSVGICQRNIHLPNYNFISRKNRAEKNIYSFPTSNLLTILKDWPSHCFCFVLFCFVSYGLLSVSCIQLFNLGKKHTTYLPKIRCQGGYWICNCWVLLCIPIKTNKSLLTDLNTPKIVHVTIRQTARKNYSSLLLSWKWFYSLFGRWIVRVVTNILRD